GPLPLLVAGGQVVGDDAAAGFATELRDAKAAGDQRRGGGVEPGPGAREVILVPEHLALRSVHAREDAADADGDDLAIGYCGRASGPGVPRGRAGHRLGGILLLPQFLAVNGVQAADDFVVTLAREDRS